MNIKIGNFRYEFNEPYHSVQCVYKLLFGQKYFIWKAKALHQSVKHMAEDIQRKIANGVKDDDLLRNIVLHCKRARVAVMGVEMIKETPTATEMLITEYDALQKAQKDEMCLNVLFEPYIPAWIPVDARQALEKHIIESRKPKKKKVTVKTKRNVRRTKKSSNTKARSKGRGSRK